MQVSLTTVKCACVEHAGQQCSTKTHICTTVQLVQHSLLVLVANPLPVTTLRLLTAGLFLHLQVRFVYFKMSCIENKTEWFFFYYSVSYTQYKVGGIRPMLLGASSFLRPSSISWHTHVLQLGGTRHPSGLNSYG